jgi:hypothetical protein
MSYSYSFLYGVDAMNLVPFPKAPSTDATPNQSVPVQRITTPQNVEFIRIKGMVNKSYKFVWNDLSVAQSTVLDSITNSTIPYHIRIRNNTTGVNVIDTMCYLISRRGSEEYLKGSELLIGKYEIEFIPKL